MPLKTFVKVSSITNLSDARYFAVYPVHWLSFEANSISTKYLPKQKIQEIVGWLEGPKYCLQVAGLNEAEIEEATSGLPIDGLELSEEQQLNTTEFTIFRRLLINTHSTIEEIETRMNSVENTDYFILDFLINDVPVEQLFNDSSSLSIRDLSHLAKAKKIIIAGHFTAEQIAQFLEFNLLGIDLLGGEEEKVGLRAFDDIQDVMEELETWE